MKTGQPEGKLRALVVDDDRSWREILEEILIEEDFEVDAVGELEGVEALLQAHPHRLAVVDLSLGGPDHNNQDGLQVLSLIERHDPLCTSLLLTGFATVELAVEAITRFHASTCLRKESFSRAAFRKLVHGMRIQLPRPTGAATPRPNQIGPVVLLVEDDAGWSKLLTEILEEANFQVVSCVSYGEAAAVLKRETISLAVVDLQLANSLTPEANHDGLALLELTRDRSLPTVVVSGTLATVEIDSTLERYGVRGFMEKHRFQKAPFVRMLAQFTGSVVALTEREREVMALLVAGLNNAEIGQKLFVSTNTVKQHLKTIFEKLGVHNRAAAVAWATGAGRSQALT
jgi:DNA-binding NarL/FixJ family response regulator